MPGRTATATAATDVAGWPLPLALGTAAAAATCGALLLLETSPTGLWATGQGSIGLRAPGTTQVTSSVRPVPTLTARPRFAAPAGHNTAIETIAQPAPASVGTSAPSRWAPTALAAVLAGAAVATVLAALRRGPAPLDALWDVEGGRVALLAATGEGRGLENLSRPKPRSESAVALQEAPNAPAASEVPPTPQPDPEPESEPEPAALPKLELPQPPLPQAPDVYKALESTPFRWGLQLGWEARRQVRQLVGQLSRQRVRDIRSDPGADDDVLEGLNCTVAVFGALTPVGKILVQKLLLRGYAIRVLLLPEWATGPVDLPDSPKLEKVTVDLLDPKALLAAMQGVGKVIYCASSLSADIDLPTRVLLDDAGPRSLCRALQDVRNTAIRRNVGAQPGRTAVTTPAKKVLAKMKSLERWGDVKITQKQVTNLPAKWAALVYEGTASFAPSTGGEAPEAQSKSAVFSGEFQANRDAVAEVALPIEATELDSLLSSELLLMKCSGDGNRYTITLEVDGVRYSTAFQAAKRWQSVRLPLEAFVSADRKPLPTKSATGTGRLILGFSAAKAVTAVSTTGRVSFRLETRFIKVVPSGLEPDFVLVSQTNIALQMGAAGAELAALQSRGEAAVRSTGLGYTIIRPAPLLDTPSGGRALIFDQARRDSTPISVADVADLCVKVLHTPSACNKAFDVSTSSGETGGLYEALSAPVTNTRRLVEVLDALDKHI